MKIFEQINKNVFVLNEIKDLPFASKIAKSMYDYHIKIKAPTNTGENNSFNFYRKPTDKQAQYVARKSGDFIGEDGRYVYFGPFSGNSVIFTSYPPGTWPDKEAKLR